MKEPLPDSTTLSHYRIISRLGAGGMGEVYLAEDTRLDRKVAIKFLPSESAADEQSKKRLIREAKAAAKLDHPNICSVYEVGEENGRAFIVLQYVEGETLASRIEHKPIELRESIDIAVQVADALAEAHSRGIIHRDIKPQNIMISGRGQARVMDFGLAKIAGSASIVESQVETQSLLTEPGIIVGTVPYMSPEQVRGEKAEEASDVFSLGCVLYELVTGRRAFARQTAAETMAAILRDEPPKLAEAGKDIPPELEFIITHCLEKKAEDRFRSARDLSLALRALLSGSRVTIPSPARSRWQISPATWRLLATIFLAAALVSAIFYFRRAPAGGGLINFSIPLPGTWITTELENQFLAVSPDGQRLAFVVESEGRRMVWVRPRDSILAEALAGTEGASSPFWSPDSRWIGFFSEGKLKKIVASGGPPQTICNLPIRSGTGTWNREGTILFAGQGGGNEGIYRVSDAGGEATLVIKFRGPSGEGFFFWPHFLPDDRHFLYLSAFTTEKRKGDAVLIGSLDTGRS